MKTVVSFLLLFFAVSANCQVSPEQLKIMMEKEWQERANANSQTINKPFPAFSVSENGKIFSNTSLIGKTVFVNFWFEACLPCMAELDGLKELYNKLQANQTFEFISFTFETEEKIKEFKAKHNIPYNIFSISREECYRLNNKNGFPTNIIIDKLGLVKYRASGVIDKDEEKTFVMNTIYPEILKNL